jgi:hypothetical protein
LERLNYPDKEKTMNILSRISIFSIASAFLLACNSPNGTSQIPGTLKLENQSFQFDILATNPSFHAPQFYQRTDSLIYINDCWALAQQPSYNTTVHYENDTVFISYTADPLSTIKDWTPTVITSLTFSAKGSFQKLVFRFVAVANARPPDSIEASHGFRDRSKQWDTSVTY